MSSIAGARKPPPGRVNLGIKQQSLASQRNQQEARANDDLINIKLNIRLLPPNLTDEDFIRQLSSYTPLIKDKSIITSYYYVEGSYPSKPFEEPSYSRAYLTIKNQTYLNRFLKDIDGKSFVEPNTNDSFVPQTSKALFNKMPTVKKQQVQDPKQENHSIEDDPYFKAFLEFLKDKKLSFDVMEVIKDAKKKDEKERKSKRREKDIARLKEKRQRSRKNKASNVTEEKKAEPEKGNGKTDNEGLVLNERKDKSNPDSENSLKKSRTRKSRSRKSKEETKPVEKLTGKEKLKDPKPSKDKSKADSGQKTLEKETLKNESGRKRVRNRNKKPKETGQDTEIKPASHSNPDKSLPKETDRPSKGTPAKELKGNGPKPKKPKSRKPKLEPKPEPTKPNKDSTKDTSNTSKIKTSGTDGNGLAKADSQQQTPKFKIQKRQSPPSN